MVRTIKILGRIAASLLFLIALECALTVGLCFEFEKYNYAAWGIQVIMLLLTLWVAVEWIEQDKI